MHPSPSAFASLAWRQSTTPAPDFACLPSALEFGSQPEANVSDAAQFKYPKPQCKKNSDRTRSPPESEIRKPCPARLSYTPKGPAQNLLFNARRALFENLTRHLS